MTYIFRSIRPFTLVIAVMTYLLGGGMAHYLGLFSNRYCFFLGLFWILLVQAAFFLLLEYFQSDKQINDDNNQPRLGSQALFIQIAAALLILAAGITILMGTLGYLNIYAILFFTIIFASLLLVAIPPIMLMRRGYGELLYAIHLSAFVPAISFVLQAGQIHRILLAFSLPLIFLGLAFFLAANFQTYASDEKHKRNTFLILLTWQKAVPFHHTLILVGYTLFFCTTVLYGFSWAITWPVFLTFPLALIQVFWLNRITAGGRPIWPFLNVLSGSMFGLTIYFLAITFWLH